jgi:hypothetical protein
MGMFTKLPKELEEVDVIVAGGTIPPHPIPIHTSTETDKTLRWSRWLRCSRSPRRSRSQPLNFGHRTRSEQLRSRSSGLPGSLPQEPVPQLEVYSVLAGQSLAAACGAETDRAFGRNTWGRVSVFWTFGGQYRLLIVITGPLSTG